MKKIVLIFVFISNVFIISFAQSAQPIIIDNLKKYWIWIDNDIAIAIGKTSYKFKKSELFFVRNQYIRLGKDSINIKQLNNGFTLIDTAYNAKINTISFVRNNLYPSIWIYNKLGSSHVLKNSKNDIIKTGISKLKNDPLLFHYTDSVIKWKSKNPEKHEPGIANVCIFFNRDNLKYEFTILRGNDSNAKKKIEKGKPIILFGNDTLFSCFKDSILSQIISDSTMLFCKVKGTYLIFDKSKITTGSNGFTIWLEKNAWLLYSLLGIISFLLGILLEKYVLKVVNWIKDVFIKKSKNSRGSVEIIAPICEFVRKDDKTAIFKVTSVPKNIDGLCSELKIKEDKITCVKTNNIEVSLELDAENWERRAKIDSFIQGRCNKETFYKINNLSDTDKPQKNNQYLLPKQGQLNILIEYGKDCAELLLKSIYKNETIVQNDVSFSSIISSIENWLPKIENNEELHSDGTDEGNTRITEVQPKADELTLKRDDLNKFINNLKILSTNVEISNKDKNDKIAELNIIISTKETEKQDAVVAAKKEQEEVDQILITQKENKLIYLQNSINQKIEDAKTIIIEEKNKEITIQKNKAEQFEKEKNEIDKKKDEYYKPIIDQKEKAIELEIENNRKEIEQIKKENQAKVDEIEKAKIKVIDAVKLEKEKEITAQINKVEQLEKEKNEIAKKKDDYYILIIEQKEREKELEKGNNQKEIERIKKDNQAKVDEIEKAKTKAIESVKNDTKRYFENVVFADELKPYAHKTLELFDMSNKLQTQCSNLYKREKNNASTEKLFNKAFAKFQSATYNLNVGEWHEQLNCIVHNGTLIIPPSGKENNHSSCYATIRQAIKESKNEKERATEFQKAISLAFLNRFCSALLVLIEDMMLLGELGVSIPDTIQVLRTDIRTLLKKELELEINDVFILSTSPKNSGIQEVDKIQTTFTMDENRVIEILSYGIERKDTKIEPTRVIVSK